MKTEASNFAVLLIFLFLLKKLVWGLQWVFFVARRIPLVVASGGYSLVVGRGLLVVAASLVQNGLQSTGEIVVVHRLSCSAACGIFPDQGLHICPLHWQVDS